MTKEEILKGNKLIAEFEGAKTVGRNMFFEGDVSFTKEEFIASLKYHESWDWLIPACKKCADISMNQDRPTINHCNKLDWLECEIGTQLSCYDIMKVYTAVIDFIKLYNKK